MTVKELNNKSFEEVMEQLNEEWDDVHTYESMADFVGDLILNQNDIYLAIHMLEAMRDNPAEWYLYDFTMGTMETPRAITCREDLEEVIEERIQDNETLQELYWNGIVLFNGGKIKMIGFIVGLIIGILGGGTVMALCVVASDSDRKMEEIMKNIK